jgi:hypothetical protein
MPALSVEFWVGTGIALFLSVFGLGVTLAMDAKTRGEFRVAAGCFLLAATSTVYVIGVFEMSAMWPARLRVPIAWGLFATVAVLASEGVRWAHARHLRAIALHEQLKGQKIEEEPGPRPEMEHGGPGSATVVVTPKITLNPLTKSEKLIVKQKPLEKLILKLTDDMQTYYDDMKPLEPLGVIADSRMPQRLIDEQEDKQRTFDKRIADNYRERFAPKVLALVYELNNRGINTKDIDNKTAEIHIGLRQIQILITTLRGYAELSAAQSQPPAQQVQRSGPLTQGQRFLLGESLRATKGWQITIVEIGKESVALGSEVAQVFRDSGWNVEEARLGELNVIVDGIKVNPSGNHLIVEMAELHTHDVTPIMIGFEKAGIPLSLNGASLRPRGAITLYMTDKQ